MTQDTDLINLHPDDWAHTFLEAYTGPTAYGTLTNACLIAGISRKKLATRLTNDTIFKTLYDEANEQIRDLVRHEILRRALEPTERPIYQRGEMVGTIQEYDNRHLEWLAERLMPEEFHIATKIELTGKGDGSAFSFQLGEHELEPGTKPPET